MEFNLLELNQVLSYIVFLMDTNLGMIFRKQEIHYQKGIIGLLISKHLF